MEEYAQAKALLFSQLGNVYQTPHYPIAVLNRDDPTSARYERNTAAQVLGYGIHEQAEIKARIREVSAEGTYFDLQTPMGQVDISLKMLGIHNVYNALAAISALLPEGFTLEQIKAGIEGLKQVDGRFQSVSIPAPYTVIVDYAHTPDGLENVLKSIKAFAKGKIYCIVGCGGNRDRSKRPIMAKIAWDLADFSVFTSDNPRDEDPQIILDEMITGIPFQSGNKRYEVLVDRKEAIWWTLTRAEAHDIILIAGKGHETYQIIGKDILPFDDREVVSSYFDIK